MYLGKSANTRKDCEEIAKDDLMLQKNWKKSGLFGKGLGKISCLEG